jgi:hypothetical protein
MTDSVAIPYTAVMPRLGLGIHEFRGSKLVDARPEAWHDDRVGCSVGVRS